MWQISTRHKLRESGASRLALQAMLKMECDTRGQTGLPKAMMSTRNGKYVDKRSILLLKCLSFFL